jgi:5-oxoprolinase (ATP-hydrolysing) subunit A
VNILLNVDLGELADEPEALYEAAHVANVACGGHAGDDASMARAVELCRVHQTRVGAHPSYPDREGFGRRPFAMAPAVLSATVKAQCDRLAAIAGTLGEPVAFVKAHGALYHAADRDPDMAEALLDAARESLGAEVIVIGPARGALARAAARVGMGYAREAFADRGTRPDGTLVPRGEPGAVIADPAEAVARARTLLSRDDVDTLCVHGDTPGAPELAAAVRRILDTATRA